MENKTTLVIGASTNPSRYSNMAIRALRSHNYKVIALAIRTGQVGDVAIQTKFPHEENIHTVTMYVGPQNQREYFQPVVDLKPERVIFNPGTENYSFSELLESKGIEAIEACTLVMLSTGQF